MMSSWVLHCELPICTVHTLGRQQQISHTCKSSLAKRQLGNRPAQLLIVTRDKRSTLLSSLWAPLNMRQANKHPWQAELSVILASRRALPCGQAQVGQFHQMVKANYLPVMPRSASGNFWKA